MHAPRDPAVDLRPRSVNRATTLADANAIRESFSQRMQAKAQARATEALLALKAPA